MHLLLKENAFISRLRDKLHESQANITLDSNNCNFISHFKLIILEPKCVTIFKLSIAIAISLK